MKALPRFYYSLRTHYGLATIVWLLRYLMAYAFIPSGMKKLLGERFTSLGTDTPVGFFFEALYRSGAYWNFLGWGQLIAAALLMTQRFATLGNLIFFFIISNITVITVAMQFTGTWLITCALFFASCCLLLWDANKLRYVLVRDNFLPHPETNRLPEASLLWEYSGALLLVISLAHTIIGGMLQKGSLEFFLGFALVVLLIVALTVILDRRSRKKITSS
jgi:uncharacterized membrane protein YphA (DoxX/SURF4 family)